MADSTQEGIVESQRFLANTEATQRNVEDETLLQDIAEFIFASSESATNPALSSQLRDLANQIVQNKGDLAKTPGNEGQPPVSPEEAFAQQGIEQQQAQAQGGGLPPEGAPQGQPPGGLPPGI